MNIKLGKLIQTYFLLKLKPVEHFYGNIYGDDQDGDTQRTAINGDG